MGKTIQTMKELPASERPYEKCVMYGPQVLSDAELLAVIIRTGCGGLRSTELAQKVLQQIPGKKDWRTISDVAGTTAGIEGIGRVKAIQLRCLTEITKRMMRSLDGEEILLCDNPAIVARAYLSMRFWRRSRFGF